MDDRYDPNLILAYVEGELDDAGLARFEAQCAADPGLRKLADQLRADCEAVRNLPRASPSSPSSESATAMMERDLLLGDEPLGSVGVVPTASSTKPRGPGHRALRFTAYAAIAATVALTGAVVVQNLTDTRLLDRARELNQPSIAVESAATAKDDGLVLADATPTPTPTFGSGSGSELSSMPRVAGETSVAASAPGPVVATAKTSKAVGNAALAEAEASGAGLGGVGGMVGDAVLADAGGENDADTAANAAMTIEETADNLPTSALAAAELPQLPPTYGFMADLEPAAEGAAEVPENTVQALAIHTPEPVQFGQDIADWVASNGGVVLVLAEQQAIEAPRENRLLSQVAKPASQRQQTPTPGSRSTPAPAPGSGSGSGSGSVSVATQQLEVLIPPGQVANFYRRIGQEVPASIAPDEAPADALLTVLGRDAEAVPAEGFEETGNQAFVRRERSVESSGPAQAQVGGRFFTDGKSPADLHRQSLFVKGAEANAEDSADDAYGWQQPAHWLTAHPTTHPTHRAHPRSRSSLWTSPANLSFKSLDAAPAPGPAVHIRLLIAPAAE